MKKEVLEFLEMHHPNYSQSEDVERLNDLQVIADKEMQPGSSAEKVYKEIKDELNSYYGHTLDQEELDFEVLNHVENEITSYTLGLLEEAIVNFQNQKP